MIYGIPEDRGLRCPYHGWCYRRDRPVHRAAVRRSRGRRALQGQDPDQGLPRAGAGRPAVRLHGPAARAAAARLGRVRDAERACATSAMPCCPATGCSVRRTASIPSTWSGCTAHCTNYVLEKLDRIPSASTRRSTPRSASTTSSTASSSGAWCEGGTEEDTAWADGHPIVFPNMLRQGGSGDGVAGHRRHDGARPSRSARPIDDYNTAHWWVACYPRMEGEAGQEPEDIPCTTRSGAAAEPRASRTGSILDSNSAQDPAAWITQGKIADRTQEHLGRSDKGIILYRQMLEDNIKQGGAGRGPDEHLPRPGRRTCICRCAPNAGRTALRGHADPPGRRDQVQPDPQRAWLRFAIGGRSGTRKP